MSRWRSRPEKLLPTVGKRTDGKSLFYRGKTHTVAGETEAGKDWLAQVAARDEMIAGNHVFYLDFEDDEDTAIDRLLSISVPPDVGEARFHYKHPRERLETETQSIEDFLEYLGVFPLGDPNEEARLSLAVIAGITQAMELQGLNPLSNIDIATFHRTVMEPIARDPDQPAAVGLDHVTKDPNSRGRYAIGGAHKLNIVSGASYILENREPFGIGLTGRSALKIAKDRPGQLRRYGVKAGGLYRYGDLVIVSQDESWADAMIEPPDTVDKADELVTLKVAITDLLRREGPLPGRQIEAKVSGNTTKKRNALRDLIEDGYVSKTPHELLTPYDPEAL
jgi:hypothetical protein